MSPGSKTFALFGFDLLGVKADYPPTAAGKARREPPFCRFSTYGWPEVWYPKFSWKLCVAALQQPGQNIPRIFRVQWNPFWVRR
jgi:hypothetical protein